MKDSSKQKSTVESQNFVEKSKRLMKQLSISTKAELANRLGVRPEHIYGIWSGRKTPSKELAALLDNMVEKPAAVSRAEAIKVKIQQLSPANIGLIEGIVSNLYEKRHKSS